MTWLPAPALLHDDRLVVLATEPRGRGLGAVVLLDRHGHMLLHTRIRPAYPGAPPLEVLWPPLAALLTGRIVVGFQVARDRRLLRQTARRLGATLLYSDWRSLAALGCRAPYLPECSSQSALAEARMALDALRALDAPPLAVPPPRRLFWRYL